jgi:cytidylate kinase
MKETVTFEECCNYVAALVQAHDHASSTRALNPPAITISRATGARGHSIGKALQVTLRAQCPNAKVPWTCFDDDLIQKVLEDHNLPVSLAKFMPEDAVNEFDSTINEILGRHPSLWTLFEQTVETMVHLCHTGHCIIVGRGGNKVAEGLRNVTRVRLIGSLSRRIQQMVTVHGMATKDAEQFIKQEDVARQRYMKHHFFCDVDDPHHYDLVINTDHYSDEAVVELILSAVASRQIQ